MNEEPKFDGKVQLRWDHSSFDAFQRCPKYYEYRYIDKLRDNYPKTQMDWGTAYHAIMEVYDSGLAEPYNMSRREALSVALAFAHDNYIGAFAGGDKQYTYEKLVEAAIKWDATYAEDTLKTATLADGKPAIEVYVTLGCEEFHGKTLSGRIDRLAYDRQGNLWIIDRKTTSSSLGPFYFKKFEPSQQGYLYLWALQDMGLNPVGFCIDACNPQVKDVKFARHFVQYPQKAIDEFKQEMVLGMLRADDCAATGFYPRNLTACGGFGQYGCPYRKLCSACPTVRHNIIEAEYIKGE